MQVDGPTVDARSQVLASVVSGVGGAGSMAFIDFGHDLISNAAGRFPRGNLGLQAGRE